MILSIIIVNWNTSELLAKCLSSIYSHPPNCPFEVWVVDNASGDDSVSMLRSRFPQVDLIENLENTGFSLANNQAIRQSHGRYVLLLNPDTEVKPGALQQMVYRIDTHPQVGAVGARLLNPDGSLQTSCYAAPTVWREFIRLFHLDFLNLHESYKMERWETTQPRRVEVIQGACLMLRRSALDQIGLLDEGFFMYSEDVDLCMRLGKAGWQLYWLPQAEVLHHGGQSSQQVAEEMFLHLYQAKLACIRKHQGNWAAVVYRLILLLASLPRLVLIPLSWVHIKPRSQRYQSLGRNYHKLLLNLAGRTGDERIKRPST
ncbi:MAG: glycosyltransferase family 2 protein [Anaerolineales bacterium]|nr:glycosyltransferase family 2 protein [Anaerolineales bacterium]